MYASTIASIVYFSVNFIFLIILGFYVYRSGSHQSIKSKSYLKDIWSQRKIYSPIIVHFYDTATDIGVVINWYYLMKQEQNNDDIDYKSVDMTVFFWTAIAFLLLYRVITLGIAFIFGCVDNGSDEFDWYDSILALFDVYILKGVYQSFKEAQHTIEHNAKIRAKKYEIKKQMETQIQTSTLEHDELNVDEEEEEIDSSTLQQEMVFLEAVTESIPQIILQSVFVIKSANDPYLSKQETNNLTLLLLSIIASLISISTKYINNWDKGFVVKTADSLK
eukprot:102566_1